MYLCGLRFKKHIILHILYIISCVSFRRLRPPEVESSVGRILCRMRNVYEVPSE